MRTLAESHHKVRRTLAESHHKVRRTLAESYQKTWALGDLEGRVLGEQGLQGACDGLLLVGVHLDGLHWHLGNLQGLQHGLLLAGNQQQQCSPLCKQRTPQHW